MVSLRESEFTNTSLGCGLMLLLASAHPLLNIISLNSDIRVYGIPDCPPYRPISSAGRWFDEFGASSDSRVVFFTRAITNTLGRY